MRKLLLTGIGSALAAMMSFAQTSLPTSSGFPTTTLPTGWTSSGAGFSYYSASGNPAPAAKFASTADKLTIFFSSSPGNLTYDLTGNSFSGGTFTVEESVNGTTYTTLHTFTAPPAVYTGFTDVPNSASRYIRFNYTNKVTGNIGLDNVSIALGSSTTQQINVKQGATTIVNGGTYSLSSPVSSNTPTTFTIQNLGTVNTLNVSGVTITGPAAADYSVGSFPPSVGPASSGSMVINFTPSVSGTRTAAINIANDDPTGNPYIINLYGVGGTLATQPTAQPTAFITAAVKSYHLNAAFAAASPAPDAGYLVLRRTGSPVTDIPVDGTVYQRGDVIGNSKVVSSSMATAFYPNEIVANTTYYFAVFSYNGPGSYRNYLTTAPLTGSVTSAPSMQPATYYNTVSTAASTFVTDLHNKINPHSIQFYSNYGSLMISKFYARDTTAGQRVITCVYSGLNKIYTEPFDFTTNDFSREHTYCHSWMPTVNNIPDNTNLPEYNDYHMLTPTNQTQVNAVRSNYPLGEVVTPISSYLGAKYGYNAAGQKVYEPRDADKGDAARCMMYEAICYTGVPYSGPANTNCVYGGSWSLPSYISTSIPYGQDQNVLKKWHYQDPPDNFEIARNDYVDSLQGNRNPFIDSIQFACYIDFMTMTKINSPLVPCNSMTTGIAGQEQHTDMMMLAPNPNNGTFVLTYVTETSQTLNIRLVDVVGRMVYSSQAKVSNGYNPIELSIPGLSKGIYTIELTTATGRKTEKLVIE
jgi:endonuclease I